MGEKDATLLKEASPTAKLFIIKGMNHVLKEVPPGDINENKKAYSNPDLVVMTELINEIINFISEKN